MVISVQFHGLHRMVTRTSEIELPLSRESRVKDVITCISNRYPDLRLGEGRVIVLVNNKITAMHQTLNPDDKITFLPPVGGG